MSLTVREQKAGSRPAGGHSTGRSATTWRGQLRGDTILRRPTLRPGPRATGQLRGRRVSTARPVRGPIGTKARAIIS